MPTAPAPIAPNNFLDGAVSAVPGSDQVQFSGKLTDVVSADRAMALGEAVHRAAEVATIASLVDKFGERETFSGTGTLLDVQVRRTGYRMAVTVDLLIDGHRASMLLIGENRAAQDLMVITDTWALHEIMATRPGIEVLYTNHLGTDGTFRPENGSSPRALRNLKIDESAIVY